ncbi:uncharacterized protein C11orf94 homolog [Trichosurus vulpecula]|uniref:uncharacterized protein C11orf94 homolog n=1 Tax=Trichosurus vulpecula TaxID=9337 RepID=UPI00186AE83C|nr:uncharacterized protein C11orf94 homolog [Trichosurus vulpecula]
MGWGQGLRTASPFVRWSYPCAFRNSPGRRDWHMSSGETVLTMLGSLCPRIGLGLFLLTLVLVAARPTSHRYQPLSIPEELDTMELPNGLVDDYGILPKHPGHRIVRSCLSRAQKRKRDGPDLSEYYYEAHQ